MALLVWVLLSRFRPLWAHGFVQLTSRRLQHYTRLTTRQKPYPSKQTPRSVMSGREASKTSDEKDHVLLETEALGYGRVLAFYLSRKIQSCLSFRWHLRTIGTLNMFCTFSFCGRPSYFTHVLPFLSFETPRFRTVVLPLSCQSPHVQCSCRCCIFGLHVQ